jgi:hypothetical protein
MHGGRRFDQDVDGQLFRLGIVERLDGTQDVFHRLDLGHHDMRQARARLAGDGGDVLLESGMLHMRV